MVVSSTTEPNVTDQEEDYARVVGYLLRRGRVRDAPFVEVDPLERRLIRILVPIGVDVRPIRDMHGRWL